MMYWLPILIIFLVSQLRVTDIEEFEYHEEPEGVNGRNSSN